MSQGRYGGGECEGLQLLMVTVGEQSFDSWLKKIIHC